MDSEGAPGLLPSTSRRSRAEDNVSLREKTQSGLAGPTSCAAPHRGRFLAYANQPECMFVAADRAPAYTPEKLNVWTRQIVCLRPHTFVMLDRVRSTRPEHKKTWLLHSRLAPQGSARAVRRNRRRPRTPRAAGAVPRTRPAPPCPGAPGGPRDGSAPRPPAGRYLAPPV